MERSRKEEEFYFVTYVRGRGRVGKSVKNSTDTIFELEILAKKMHAKICINVQNEQTNAKNCKNLQKFAKMLKNTTKVC